MKMSIAFASSYSISATNESGLYRYIVVSGRMTEIPVKRASPLVEPIFVLSTGPSNFSLLATSRRQWVLAKKPLSQTAQSLAITIACFCGSLLQHNAI